MKKVVERLCESYKDAYARIRDEVVRHANAEKDFKEKSKLYSTTAIRDGEKEIRQEHEKNVAEIKKQIREARETARKEFEGAVRDACMPKAEDLNASDVTLLNSGIVLSKEEVERMAQRHEGNATMMRVIETYVQKNGIEVAVPVKNKFLAANKTVELATDAFNVFDSRANASVGLMWYNDVNNETFDKCNARIAQYAEDFSNAIGGGSQESEVK